MKRTIIAALFITILTLWTCENKSIVETVEPTPIIENLTLHYSELNHSLFIAAKVEDAQGWDNLDSVVFNLYRINTIDSMNGVLFKSEKLSDDGPPRDIITQDGVFSYLIDSTELGSYEGYYRVIVQAYDADGNVSDSATATELVQANSPPEIFLLSAPTTFEKWDTLKFYFRVTDKQGYDDIVGVYYSILRPDGQFFDPYFYLNDAGEYGDEKARDGIFTVFQPSNPESKYQGLYTFYFFAEDYSGAMSDTITLKIPNPGIYITAPNSALTLRFGQTLRIMWEYAYISRVKIEYTFNANETNPDWIVADTTAAALKYYDWTVPATQVTDYCKVRVSDLTKPARYDVNDDYLVITQ